jgi:hypothetical protein
VQLRAPIYQTPDPPSSSSSSSTLTSQESEMRSENVIRDCNVCVCMCVSLHILPSVRKKPKPKPKVKVKVKSQEYPQRTPGAPMLNDVYSFGVWSLSLSCLSISPSSLSISLSPSTTHFLLSSLDLRPNPTRDESVPINTLGLVRRGR